MPEKSQRSVYLTCSIDLRRADKKVFFADGNAFRAKRMIRILDSANKKKVLATVGKDLSGEGYYLKKGETLQVRGNVAKSSCAK